MVKYKVLNFNQHGEKTKKLIKKLEKILPYWLKNVDLIQRPSDPDGAVATIVLMPEYKKVIVSVMPEFHTYSLEEQEDCILHEMAHAVNGAYCDFVMDVLSWIEKRNPDVAEAFYTQHTKVFESTTEELKETLKGLI